MADLKKLGGNDQIESYARSEFGKNGRVQAMVHHRQLMDQRANLAVAFVERWGMVAAESDGEDSAGRSKVKLSSPNDVVARAITMVEIMWPALQDRGWIVEVPSFTDYVAAAKLED